VVGVLNLSGRSSLRAVASPFTRFSAFTLVALFIAVVTALVIAMAVVIVLFEFRAAPDPRVLSALNQGPLPVGDVLKWEDR